MSRPLHFALIFIISFELAFLKPVTLFAQEEIEATPSVQFDMNCKTAIIEEHPEFEDLFDLSTSESVKLKILESYIYFLVTQILNQSKPPSKSACLEQSLTYLPFLHSTDYYLSWAKEILRYSPKKPLGQFEKDIFVQRAFKLMKFLETGWNYRYAPSLGQHTIIESNISLASFAVAFMAFIVAIGSKGKVLKAFREIGSRFLQHAEKMLGGKLFSGSRGLVVARATPVAGGVGGAGVGMGTEIKGNCAENGRCRNDDIEPEVTGKIEVVPPSPAFLWIQNEKDKWNKDFGGRGWLDYNLNRAHYGLSYADSIFYGHLFGLGASVGASSVLLRYLFEPRAEYLDRKRAQVASFGRDLQKLKTNSRTGKDLSLKRRMVNQAAGKSLEVLEKVPYFRLLALGVGGVALESILAYGFGPVYNEAKAQRRFKEAQLELFAILEKRKKSGRSSPLDHFSFNLDLYSHAYQAYFNFVRTPYATAMGQAHYSFLRNLYCDEWRYQKYKKPCPQNPDKGRPDLCIERHRLADFEKLEHRLKDRVHKSQFVNDFTNAYTDYSDSFAKSKHITQEYTQDLQALLESNGGDREVLTEGEQNQVSILLDMVKKVKAEMLPEESLEDQRNLSLTKNQEFLCALLGDRRPNLSCPKSPFSTEDAENGLSDEELNELAKKVSCEDWSHAPVLSDTSPY